MTRQHREDDDLEQALRRARAERPTDGYQLSDFDDIPFPTGHRPEAAAAAPEAPSGVRLQKALANAGVASRRVCERFITDGRVEVNGQVVTELGTRIDPDVDRVKVDGTPVQLDQTRRYVILNKPVRVVSSMRDEHGRRDLTEFVSQYDERLYNVGRLDYETSGLLILTNDGELAHVLAHPSFGVPKTYIAKVDGKVPPAAVQRLRVGFELEDGFIQADSARILARGSSAKATLIELTLHSGRNRIVRRMLDHIGYPVRELVRRSFGPLHLGTLREGESRELTRDELGALLKLGRGGDTSERPVAQPEQDAREGRQRDTEPRTNRGQRDDSQRRRQGRPSTGKPGKGAYGKRGSAARETRNQSRRRGNPRGGTR